MSDIPSSTAATEAPPSPIMRAPLPFSTRINCAIRLWAFKIFVKVAVGIHRFLKPSPVETRPTYTKYYPPRPGIKNRVFVPKTYKPGDKALPLYINIHGGGFAVGDPQFDDHLASMMCEKGICVVSIGYRLSPIWSHPTQVHDCAALAQAVLDDPELDFVDKKNAAIGGYSAGGNLSLGLTQLESMRGKFAGVVGLYPAVDFARTIEQMLKERADTSGKKDKLQGLGNLFNWGFIPEGTDRTDPSLSPFFAKKEHLPKNVCLVGCELDILCRAAEDMAEKLARGEEGERKDFTEGSGWEVGSVRWEKLLGQEHGFDHVVEKGEREVDRLKVTKEVHDRVADWLFRKVYA
ncbi:hypothetical protein MMC06_006356 [Schaereria dolodes]|nr:hypothetical protein [Schaereria dolodes]